MQEFGLSSWIYDAVIKTFSPDISAPFVFSCLTGRPPKLCTQAAPGLTVGLTTSPAAQTERNPLPSATADTRSLSEGWDAAFLLRGNLCPQAFPPLPCTYVWSQPRIQFVPFILFIKLEMTQLDTKRKGFPNTSCLISSTVHHTVNIFLLNYKKLILSHVWSSSVVEKAQQKTVWDWVRPKGTKGLWIPWKNLLWQFYIFPIESYILMYPPVSKKTGKFMWKITWYINVQDTLPLLDYFPYFWGQLLWLSTVWSTDTGHFCGEDHGLTWPTRIATVLFIAGQTLTCKGVSIFRCTM